MSTNVESPGRLGTRGLGVVAYGIEHWVLRWVQGGDVLAWNGIPGKQQSEAESGVVNRVIWQRRMHSEVDIQHDIVY